MKKRTLGLIIAGVAAASMIGTGFAAWVITGNAKAELTGNFAVDAVSDKGISLTAAWDKDSDADVNTINFLGAPNANVENPWLTYTSTATENLDLNINITADWAADAAATDYVATFKFEAVGEGYQTAITNKYIVAPTLTIGSTVVTMDGETTYGLGTLGFEDGVSKVAVIAFDWGKTFGDTNPYSFYNDFKYDDKVLKDTNGTPVADTTNQAVTIQTYAKTDLAGLESALTGVTFKLTIEVKGA